jgi:ribosomal protein L16 Arg81 hydroxylase
MNILTHHGFHPAVSAHEIIQAQTHPYLKAVEALNRKIEKRDWVLSLQRISEQLSPDYGKVERREKLSTEEFLTDYYSKGRPVIITGVLNRWPAMSRWTPDYLKAQCGEREVEIQFGRETDPNYEIHSMALKKVVRFADYVDMVFQGGETNDYYMTANNSNTNGTALRTLWQDLDPLPEYLHNEGEGTGFFWMGPKGTVTPLHHDLTNNFMAQVWGRKLIKLIPANQLQFVYNHHHCFSAVDLNNVDYDKYPAFKNVKPIEVVLEPGELLFLPVGCWHHVTGWDPTITMTYTNFLWFNNFAKYYTTHGDI